MLHGGSDWFIRRMDGVVEVDARTTLRTDDGHLIYCSIRGINDMSIEDALKAISGEVIEPSRYYFRTTPILETASEKYSWLNRIVIVGVGTLTATGAVHKMYTVL